MADEREKSSFCNKTYKNRWRQRAGRLKTQKFRWRAAASRSSAVGVEFPPYRKEQIETNGIRTRTWPRRGR